jgi:plasmid stabilization system protein ParE
MPQKFKLSKQAQFELSAIIRFIAKDRPKAARNLRQKFREAFELLGENPKIGYMKPDITHREVRFWHLYHYAIIYTDEPNYVFILQIISYQRNIPELISL